MFENQYPATFGNANFYRLKCGSAKLLNLPNKISLLRIICWTKILIYLNLKINKAKCGSILNNHDKTNKSSYYVKVGSDVNSKPCELQLVEKNLSNLKINNIILNYLTSLLKGSFKII